MFKCVFYHFYPTPFLYLNTSFSFHLLRFELLYLSSCLPSLFLIVYYIPIFRKPLLFFTKNGILNINHSLYSPYLAACDFYLFGKLQLAMKGKSYADIEDIQRLPTTILNIISLIKEKCLSIHFLTVQSGVLSPKRATLNEINLFC